jgi:hypothetical protein
VWALLSIWFEPRKLRLRSFSVQGERLDERPQNAPLTPKGRRRPALGHPRVPDGELQVERHRPSRVSDSQLYIPPTKSQARGGAEAVQDVPLSNDDLPTLIDLGLVEMRDAGPALTNAGHAALD